MAHANTASHDSTDYVRIFDTTLRDGEQSPGCTMNVEEKIALARQLERLNVDIIEAGFAVSSPGDFESITRVAQARHGAGGAELVAHRREGRRFGVAAQSTRPRIRGFIFSSRPRKSISSTNST